MTVLSRGPAGTCAKTCRECLQPRRCSTETLQKPVPEPAERACTSATSSRHRAKQDEQRLPPLRQLGGNLHVPFGFALPPGIRHRRSPGHLPEPVPEPAKSLCTSAASKLDEEAAGACARTYQDCMHPCHVMMCSRAGSWSLCQNALGMRAPLPCHDVIARKKVRPFRCERKKQTCG